MSATARNENVEKLPHRLSVTLTDEQHREVTEIARKNRVSAAWVVRQAVERFLKDQMPLLHVGKE
ncbi:CopG family transcriptional regulator [Mesorhizobium sp. CA16]|uniref:ribbon-helix-helix domain-containing protein n=1 Tax=Mesorhizobium sp. CA16 TaxID=588496 RepID=UPI001CCD4098|nr:CopG family transcriptional regulator [Mesorhizobium sp. CA16]MBZ9910993.1 ribbon-helix-helix domain-containing protein [Mesorhizobium sp. CA16]